MEGAILVPSFIYIKGGFNPPKELKMQCHDAKDGTGFLQSRMNVTPHISPLAVSGVLGNLKLEKEASSIGKSLYVPPRRFPSLASPSCLDPFMGNSLDRKQLSTTVGKKLLESWVLSSKSGDGMFWV